MDDISARTGRKDHLRTAVAVGVDIGGTHLRAATVDGNGRILERRRAATPADDADRLVGGITRICDDLGPDLPVGIGIAGVVTADGDLRYGPNIAVRELQLGRMLRAVLGRRVVVVNDASAAALGEHRAGAGRGVDGLVLLTVGTGVGGGVVVGRRLVRGTNGTAGELGHVTVVDDGRECGCGLRGCLEAYASAHAIASIARERWKEAGHRVGESGQDIDAAFVVRAARDQDAIADGVLVEAGRRLGEVVSALVTVLDPGLVLLGGGAAPAMAPWLLPGVEREMADRVFAADFRTLPPVRLAGQGDDAGTIGAATLALEGDADGEETP